MIKLIFIGMAILSFTEFGYAQIATFEDTATSYFNEIKTATDEHESLWGISLYAPMLLVQPETRRLYTNFQDSAGLLKMNGTIYTGMLPVSVNISNTSLRWSGRSWAMIMLPLPEKKADRINLLAHELFHRAQDELGFKAYNPENNHLDLKNGRIYLRLELEALKKAVLSKTQAEINENVTNALIFRKYRYALYPNADSTENLLELNEGVTEYTGVMLSGRNKEQMQKHFIENIDRFLISPTYVRSFAYQTTPVYGYLLSETRKGWNKQITTQTKLFDYFIKAFDLLLPNDINKKIKSIAATYGSQQIIDEESAREEKTKRKIADYKKKFIAQPHLDLPLQNMNMSFDFRTIMPLEDKGTVYPTIRITDNWGILEVEKGALISPNWDKLTVSVPIKFEKQKISGDGWALEINESFLVTKDEASGNYKLEKK